MREGFDRRLRSRSIGKKKLPYFTFDRFLKQRSFCTASLSTEIPLETSPDEWIVDDVKSPPATLPLPAGSAHSSLTPTESPAAAAAPASPAASASPAPSTEMSAATPSTASPDVSSAAPAMTKTPEPAVQKGAQDEPPTASTTAAAAAQERPPAARGQITEESCMSETEIEPPSDADVEDNAETDSRYWYRFLD